DGDQMAVHVPLSTMAQAEARVLMLSTQNLFSPADGRPTFAPVQDIILGNYALTFISQEAKAQLAEQERLHAEDPEKNPAPYIHSCPDEVLFRLDHPDADLRLQVNGPIKVRLNRPLFRPDEEVDYRDPISGIEYKKEVHLDEDEKEVEELVPLEQEWETIIATTTPGQLIFNSILPYPLRYADKYLKAEQAKKALAEAILDCHKRSGLGCTIKFLDDMKDLGFKWATRYGLSVAITDMDPPARREEMIRNADDLSNKILGQFRRGMLAYNEMTQQLTKLWQETYTQVGEEIVKSLEQFNPLSIVTVSGARGSIKQVAQLSGMRGLMLNQFNEVIYELPVKSSFHKGLNMLEYFVTTHGARKGLADTALRTADAGYLTRRLCDVAQDVIVKAHDCETQEGFYVHRLIEEGETIEHLADRVWGRVSLCTITDPDTKEVLASFDEMISQDQAKRIQAIETKYYNAFTKLTDENEIKKLADEYADLGFRIDEHGHCCVYLRSPLTCELEQGICSRCYGADLSTGKLVEVGVAVGIIAAQSIGEPGTQLTMRTFHTGGVAGSATIARTNQYKTGKFIRLFMEDFAQATDTDLKQFDPTKLLESQDKAVSVLFTKYEKPLTINLDEAMAAAEVELDPKAKRKSERITKAALKAAEKADSDSRKLWEKSRKTFFYSWTGESSGIVRVEEIFEARRQPRGKAIICPVTGTVEDVKESQYGRWVLVKATVKVRGTMKDAYIADVQPTWPTNDKGEYDAGLMKTIGQKFTTTVLAQFRKAEIAEVTVFYPILVPPLGKLPVSKGSRIIKGDPLTEGPRDPHEVLELAGANAVYDYFIENLQHVYKSQGVDINDKHVEVIIRQMLRKRQVIEPGDTPFLPGQIVDRFTFQSANNAVRERILSGSKVKYTDLVTGELVEREYREASSAWILLGITEASLATDSFLSAASFQKTTRVLTEAAVRGKKDQLIGLKENVILGRLIPAGTGVKRYREVAVDVQRGPAWAEQSLTALVEAQEGEDDLFGALDFGSLTEMALGEELTEGLGEEIEPTEE
ncbi:MAG: hypothetical protein JST35_03210, partial [Armatimonadetes bacterium]|nr:hypothetical protein [Armatimonadota bacterium]